MRLALALAWILYIGVMLWTTYPWAQEEKPVYRKGYFRDA